MAVTVFTDESQREQVTERLLFSESFLRNQSGGIILAVASGHCEPPSDSLAPSQAGLHSSGRKKEGDEMRLSRDVFLFPPLRQLLICYICSKECDS